MSRLARAITLLACALLAMPLHATTYYVRTSGSDSNNGKSAGAAWRTVTKAVATAVSGDVIYVGAGSYSGALTPTSGGASAGQPIQYFGDTTGAQTGDAGTVTITTSSGVTLTISGKSNITFRNFAFVQTGGGHVVSLTTGASNIIFSACSMSGGNYGININASDAVITSCTVSGAGGHGINVNASGKSISITDTTITSSGTDGINISNGTVTIDRCTSSGNTGDGIQAGGGSCAISNSVLVSNGSRGYYSSGADPAALYSSTVAYNASNGVQKTSGGASLTVQGCILSNNGGYGITASGAMPTENYNLYYSNTSGSTNHTSGGAGTVSGNPKFVNAGAGDYHLQSSSPAIGAGSSVGPVSDRDGIVRFGSWDIGAYERSGLTAANVPYTFDFNSAPGAEWALNSRTAGSGGYAYGSFSGPFGLVSGSNQQQVLALNVTAGTTYTLYFDLLILDTWAGESFTVSTGGANIFSQTFTGSGTSGSSSFATTPSLSAVNIGGGSGKDRFWRRAWAQFTPTSSTVYLTFTGSCASSTSVQSWAIDNVSVAAATNATTPYTCDFTTVPGPEWGLQTTTNNANVGFYSGTFGHQGTNATDPTDTQSLTLATTVGQVYYVAFDLFIIDTWDGTSTTYGPDSFHVAVNGSQVFNYYFANNSPEAQQTYPFNPDIYADLGLGNRNISAVYRRVWCKFTASATTSQITFWDITNYDITDESWGMQNIAVRSASDSNLFNTQSPGGTLVNSMPRFLDVTSSVGPSLSWSDSSASSGGIHVADLNNDGLQDLVVGGGSTAYRVLTTSPSAGVYAMTALGFANSYAARYGVLLDYDRDGYMDYHGYNASSAAGSIYRGAASLGASWSATSISGLSGMGTREFACAVNTNSDASQDLIIFDSAGAVYAALNQSTTTGSPPTPTFSMNTTTFPQSGGAGQYGASADLNNVGRQAVYFATGTGKLWSPDSSGVYSVVTRGMSVPGSSTPFAAAWADFNNDGWPDLLVTCQSTGDPHLYRNPGNASGNFVNVNNSSAASGAGLAYAGISPPGAQRGVAWGDYDNDGYLDLYICTTSGGRLYRNNGDGTFSLTNQACAVYGDVADAVFVDYDNDGDMDLVVTLGSSGTTRVFENLSNLVNANANYLKVRVLAKDAAGNYTIPDSRCRVELWNAAGTTFLQRRDIGAQRGTGTEPFWAHFGGISAGTTYTVKVFYPGGSASQTVVPNAASTTIGSRTIAQMLTVNIAPSRPKIASWTDTNPN